MGLFDLPGPLFGLIDELLAGLLPAMVRLLLWGVLAGWLTMAVYRRLSNQEKIRQLKEQQKRWQRRIADFDGELPELFPLIRQALGVGLRQLGLSLGPALLATIPVLFLLAWVAGRFAYEQPRPGTPVEVTVSGQDPDAPGLSWHPERAVSVTPEGWTLTWPAKGQSVQLRQSDLVLLELPAPRPVPVIHKRAWWNWLFANPIGYLPGRATVQAVHIGLPAQRFMPFGPDWMRGWMFTFFLTLLVSSVAFKLLLKID